jgi:hypothetical protein
MWHLRSIVLCTGLLFLTVIAYLPLWGNDFIDYDDEVYITSNPQVVEGLTWSGVGWAWTNDLAPYWLPITWMSWQLDAQLSPRTAEGAVFLSPAVFHGQNLFWHGVNVLLLFVLWYRLTGARWRSFLVAALFAVHPMRVESVAWAIERKDVLSGFFGLLAVWAYVRYSEHPGWMRYLGVAVAFLLSLLCKPMLLTLPLVLLLLDYWPLRRFGQATGTGQVVKRSLRWLVLEKAPLFAIMVMIACLTMDSRDRHGSMIPLGTISLSSRLANALIAYGCYLSTTLYPSGLAVLYPHPGNYWSPLRALVGAGCLLSITALGVWQARRRPWLIVGWLWFVITLLPVIGLAQGGSQSWADRFTYWPHMGLFTALVWGCAELADRLHLGPVVRGVAAALVVGSLAAVTWVQVGYWQCSTTVWERTAAVTTDNHWAHQRLSRCYRREGRLAEAEFHLAEATRIQFKRPRR